MMVAFTQGSNTVFVQSEARRMLNCSASILSTLGYLKRVQRKTARTKLSPDCEREVLSRVYAGSRYLRMALHSHLRIYRHLFTTGGLERVISEFKGIAAELPGISAVDFWKCGTEVYGTAALFAEYGIAADAFRQLDETVRQVNCHFRVIQDQLNVQRPDKEWIPVVVRHANDRATADRLWRPDDVDIVLNALMRRGPLGVEVFALPNGPEGKKALPCDLLTLQAVAAVRAVADAESYVCVLKEAGMPVYSGRDPGFLVAIAVVAIAVAAVATIVTIVCLATGDYESGKGFKSKGCNVASWLILVGLAISLASFFGSGDPNTKMCLNGTCYRNRNELFPNDPKI